MADELTCSECGKQIESTDDLEREEVHGIEVADDKSFDLHGSDDLFLCSGCRKPMGVGRSGSSD